MITAIRPSFGTGTGIAATYVRSFFFYGDKFECRYKDVSSAIVIYVDGKRNASDIVTATNTGAIKYFSVTFPDSKLRRIDIGCYNARIGAIFTDDTDTVSPSLNPKKILVAGDSFTEGTGATAQGMGFATRLSELSGNFNLVVSGSGGTGYVATNNGRPNLETRAQTDIVDQSPDIVIIAMGINDSLDITSAVTNTVDTIQTGLPDATIVLVGSWTAGEATGQMITNTAIIESVANSKGVYFINPTGTANADGWITGTGDDGAPIGDGNADIFVSSDGTHPNDAGHLYLAQRLATELASLNIIKPTTLDLSGSAEINYIEELSALKTAQEVSDAAEKVKVGLATSTDTNFAPQLPDADTSATITTDITNPTLTKEWDKFFR